MEDYNTSSVVYRKKQKIHPNKNSKSIKRYYTWTCKTDYKKIKSFALIILTHLKAIVIPQRRQAMANKLNMTSLEETRGAKKELFYEN